MVSVHRYTCSIKMGSVSKQAHDQDAQSKKWKKKGIVNDFVKGRERYSEEETVALPSIEERVVRDKLGP